MKDHGILKEIRWECVHFFDSDKLSDIARELGTAFVKVNVEEVESKEDFFELLSGTFQFPDYFGRNWDAVSDCLRDDYCMPERGYILQLNGAENFWRNVPMVAGHFVEVWLCAAEWWAKCDKPFHLVFVME